MSRYTGVPLRFSLPLPLRVSITEAVLQQLSLAMVVIDTSAKESDFLCTFRLRHWI